MSRPAARVLVLAVALVVLVVTGARAARAGGFDHLAHRTRLEVAGAEQPACVRCHPVTAAGALAARPGHAACFPCHGPAPRATARPPAAPSPVCAACHVPTARGGRPPLTAAYGPERDHGLQLDHARHAAPCEGCHPAMTAATPPARPAHARCASCHRTTAPTMTTCGGCHPAEVNPQPGPVLVPGPIAVGAAYDHARHAARAPGHPAARCEACHQAVAASHGATLPAPSAAACGAAGCHDGGAAFALTTACTRCHTTARRGGGSPPPQRRFLHRDHAALTAIDACQRCHGLAADGQPTAPTHAACADAACHASDFGRPDPITCGACHLAADPWRHLLPDQRPPDDTELGVVLPHARHPARCAACHQRTTAGHPLRPPRGHTACTGGGCHAATAGPAPRLGACAACHQPGATDERRRRRSLAVWSVAATFDHDRHALDPRDGRPTPCAACHPPPDEAGGIDDVPRPAKASCAPCHDGTTAFKLTGHGCARCHRGAPGGGG